MRYISLYDLYLILVDIDNLSNKIRAIENCTFLIRKYGYYCQFDVNAIGLLIEGRI